LTPFDQAQTWTERCLLLGAYLNLGAPAPLAVVRRAMQDETFYQALLAARESPAAVQRLLADPENQAYAPPPPAVASQSALMARAAKAMLTWGKAGFPRVEAARFERRWSACQRCPNLIDPPDLPVYQAFAQGDRRICARCGCVAVRKAQVPTERCPEADPQNPAVSRWGE
jgi:hypothetical protein